MIADELPVERLQLDPANPRVPATTGEPQLDLLSYFYQRGSLTELANSLLDNGFFTSEPLVVRAIPGSKDYLVLGGNRRLATLMILHQRPLADGMRLTDEPPTEGQLGRLAVIPVLILNSDELVEQYLANQHTTGVTTWSAGRKARFIARLPGSSDSSGVYGAHRI